MPSSIFSSDGRRRLRRLPGIVAAILCAFAIVEFALWNNTWWLTFLARYTAHDSDMDPAWVTASVRLLSQDARYPLLVLMGSSQIREGLDADSLAQALGGRRCLNLSLSGGSPLDMLAVLVDLDARAPRRQLVVGLSAQMLDRGPKEPFLRFGELPMVARLSPASERGAPETARVLISAALCDLSPTLRHKDSIMELFGKLKGKLSDALLLRLPPIRRFKVEDERSMTDEAVRRRVAELTGAEAEEVGDWIVLQREALLRLLRRESSRRNPVLLFDFPMRPGSKGIIQEWLVPLYDDLLRECDEIPGVTLVGPQTFDGLDGRFYADITHLNAAGRRELTRRLSEIVKSAPVPGR